jgi:hypothetical protein
MDETQDMEVDSPPLMPIFFIENNEEPNINDNGVASYCFF